MLLRKLAVGIIASHNPYWRELVNALGSIIIGYWPGWDTSGAVTDVVNARNGALVGTAAFGATGIGDGRTMINLGAAGGVNVYSTALRDAFTGAAGAVGGWYARAADDWTTGTTYAYLMRADNNNRIMLIFGTNLTAYYIAGGTSKTVLVPPMSGTRLVHFMQAWDKAAETFDLYINGAKQPTTGATLGTWAGLPAADSMYLGAGQANGNNFPGRMGHNVLLNVAPTYAQSQLIAKSRGVICFEGDSRTAAKSWPFAAAEAGTQDGGLFAFGGRGVSCMATSGANHLIIDARKATIDAHIQPGKSNILVFWAGVNCGALGGGIYEWARDYLLARRAAGWTKIVWCSEIDGNPANWHAANWPAFNAEWAADTTTADVKVDLGAIPQLQDYTNATYFVDGIHLTAAGYALVQTAVTAGIAAAV